MKNELRRLAEEKIASSPEKSESLSPNDMRQALHELRVHQIELEMQNEELRTSQEQLAASQARYFDLYDLAPVGYCTVSEKGIILEANVTAATLLDVPRSSMIKQPFSKFILKEDANSYYLHWRQLFQSAAPVSFELRMMKNDGSTFWANLEATISQDADGAPTCRIVLSDITERKLQEDERALISRTILLISSSSDFHELMSSLTTSLQGWSGCEAVAIRLRDGDDYPYYESRGFPPKFIHEENHLCAYGQDGEILRDAKGNPVLECMCGNILSGRFDPSKPFFTENGSFWTNSTTALLASTTEADRQSHTRNRCNTAGYESVALIPLRDDGQVFGLLQFNDPRQNRFTSSTIARFERMADSLAIALSRRQEQEKLKKSEEALRVSESKIRALFDQTFQLIGMMTLDGTLVEANRTAIQFAGIKESDCIGKPFWDTPWWTHSEEMQVKLREAVEKAANGETVGFEATHLAADGNTHYLDFSIKPIKDGNGKVIFLMPEGRDITEHKQFEAEKAKLEEQNRQLQKAESLSRMAGAIAHNFNNQLQAVMGNLEMAASELSDGRNPAENLDESMKAAHKVAEISKMMLTYLGQTSGKRTSLDFSEFCRMSLPILQATIPKNIKLETDLPSIRLLINANAVEIQQILTNLLTNAQEAIDEKTGTVHLGVNTVSETDIPALHRFPVKWQAKDQKYACLEIMDSGCGIQEKDMEKLFDPFFSTKFTGRGMGLSVALGIVNAHDGCITVENNINGGSIFKVFLPISDGASKSPKSDKSDRSDRPLKGGTVLLVEDENAVRKMVSIMLSSFKFTVLQARDGVEAVEIFKQHKDEISCMLCDLTMPRMGGWDTIAAIRAIKHDLPVVLTSGYDESNVMNGKHSEMPDYFLSKPYELEKLLDAIGHVMARKKR